MNEADRSKQIAALGDLAHLLPRTGRDFRYFVALSITAGIAEEILYRGFALWYLQLYLPLWAAVLVSSTAFGLGHSYQGIAGVLRTGLAGLAFAILYLVTGSIWLPIAAHIAVDILQGAAIFELLRRTQGDVRVQ
jgi:membrane protease YdiL (CAAX protease family)